MKKQVKMGNGQKVVLAYSGGLDTSIILKWLTKNLNYQVVAVCVDVGQNQDYTGLEKKAIKSGACKVLIIDAKKEFIEEYAFKGLMAGAIYEDDYLLGTTYSRPLIGKILVDIAHQEGAKIISHGATGKGNDQVRFETAVKAIDPSITIIAPWRIWDFESRVDLLNYAEENGIDFEVKKEDTYSTDDNIWHISHEGLDLEDPAKPHKSSMYTKTKAIEDTPDTPTFLSISFEKGLPVAIDGQHLTPLELITKLNGLAGEHGIGVIDIVENRLVGMKSRGVYESPGASVLYHALKTLEKICLDKDTLHFKHIISQKYADILYNGKWFSPLREALDKFLEESQKWVIGTIELKLFKGNIMNMGVKSEYSLYSEELVSFDANIGYDQSDAEGFIHLHSLPLSICAKVHGNHN